MSTTTVSVNSYAEEVRLAQLREQEALERERQREAARQREADQREAERRGRALAVIGELDATWRGLLSRMDAAAARLPDFVLATPALPGLPAGADGAVLERHAARLRDLSRDFALRLERETARAEERLAERLAKAALWRDIEDTEHRIGLDMAMTNELTACLQGGGARPASVQPAGPARPPRDASLDTLRAHIARLRGVADAARIARTDVEQRVASQERALALGGTAVRAVSASQAMAAHRQAHDGMIHADLRRRLSDGLARHGIDADTISPALAAMLTEIVAHAARHPARFDAWVSTLETCIGREAARRESTRRAEALLHCVPECVMQADDLLALPVRAAQRVRNRWQALCQRLERVMAGIESFTPEIDIEYQQIRQDAQDAMRYAYTREVFIRRVRGQGLEVYVEEGGDASPGERLVLVDPRHLDVWIDVLCESGNDGSFAATNRVLTDAPPGSLGDEGQITRQLCGTLQRINESEGPVSVETHIAEEKPVITRAKRRGKLTRRMPFPGAN